MNKECFNAMEQKGNKVQVVIDFIVDRSKLVEKVFAIVFIINAICFSFVGINYDLSKYLPSTMPSKQGISLMEKEFGYPGTARVMISDVTINEAKSYEDRIKSISGVDMVIWADSITDVYQTNSFIQYEDIKDYYKDGYAVMDVTFKYGDSDKSTRDAIKEIKDMLGDKCYLSGSAVQSKFLSEAVPKEMVYILVLSIITILSILILATNSWFEPVIFMAVIIISIVINMGSNLIFGNISSMTLSVAAVLQLAIAMDYTIILMDNFYKERKRGASVPDALKKGIRKSIVPIFSAGAAAFVGFIALVLMQYSIGRDIGLVLAKGIVISLFTVTFLTPAFILRWDSLIEKTKHKPFVPSFSLPARWVYKLRYVILIFLILITIPSYIGKDMTSFTFGSDAMGLSKGTTVYNDEQKINSIFGRNNIVLLIVPNNSIVTERQLTDELKDKQYIKNVTSLAKLLPEGVPEDFIPDNEKSKLHTSNYSRILLSIRSKSESDFSFQCIDDVSKIMKKYYPKNSYVIGSTPSTMDIKSVIVGDWNKIDKVSLLGVAIAIMVAFRSPILPLILMIPIEMAVFINMTFPYLLGDQIMFMGYIIVSCLQLGATIDYSIILTHHYLKWRKTRNAVKASIKATSDSMLPILTSGLILSVAGFGVYLLSSVQAIGDLGILICRGALLSTFTVITLLPNLLIWGDKFIISEGNIIKIDVFRKIWLKIMGCFKKRIWRKRLVKKMHKWKSIISGILVLIITLGYCGGFVCAAEPNVTTDETAYVNLDYYGTVSSVNIVKSCSLNGISQFEDYGAYESVSNMSTHDQPIIENGDVKWNLKSPDYNKRFYYNCKMKNNALTFPWNIDVSYKLNGVPCKAETLAGVSGLVEININVKPNDKAKEYYKNNMMLQAATYVNMEDVYSLEAPGSQLQTAGTYKAVLFTALPGEEDTYTIRVGTKSFKTDGINFMMVPGTLKQFEDIKEIKEAKDKMHDSYNAIYTSMDDVLNNLDGMKQGLGELQAGTAGLEDARKTFSSGKDQMNKYGDTALNDLTATNEQLKNVIPYFKSTKQMIKKLRANINSMKSTIDELKDPLEDTNGSIIAMENDLDSLDGGLGNLNDAIEKALNDLGTLVSYGIATQYEAAKLQGTASVAKVLSNYTNNINAVLDDMKSLGASTSRIISISEDLIDKNDDLVDTINSYYGKTQNLLSDLENCTSLLCRSIDSSITFLNYSKALIQTSGDKLDKATEISLNGMQSILGNGINGLGSIPAMRNANNTIKSTLDKEFNKFDGENKFLNMDAKAKPISFTSDSNPRPESIQVIMRTKEINVDDKTSSNLDLDKDKVKISFMDRIKNILKQLLSR